MLQVMLGEYQYKLDKSHHGLYNLCKKYFTKDRDSCLTLDRNLTNTQNHATSFLFPLILGMLYKLHHRLWNMPILEKNKFNFKLPGKEFI